jgi:hypothetical protein
MNKFERLEALCGKVAHTHMKCRVMGRRLTVVFYNVKTIVATWIATDEVAWEVK